MSHARTHDTSEFLVLILLIVRVFAQIDKAFYYFSLTHLWTQIGSIEEGHRVENKVSLKALSVENEREYQRHFSTVLF